MLVIGCCCLVGLSSAAADTRATVAGAVRDHIDVSSDGVAPKAKVLIRGAWSTGDVVRDLYSLEGDPQSLFESALGKLDIVVDDARGFAWFHGGATFTRMGEGAMSADTKVRIHGIATKDAKWKIVAIGYTEGIDDELMLETAGKLKLAAPTTTVYEGDAATAKTFAGWFSTGLASQAGKGNVIANGTAASEVGAGPAAIKLARAWDKLKLGVYKVSATTFANGEIAFVRAAVAWRAKKILVPMVVSAVVVKEAGAWKWVSLNFTDYTTPPRDQWDLK